MFDISKAELVQMGRYGRLRAREDDALVVSVSTSKGDRRLRFNFSDDSLEKMGKPARMYVALDERQSRLYFIPAETNDRYSYKVSMTTGASRGLVTITIDNSRNSTTQKIESVYSGFVYGNLYEDKTPSGQKVFYVSKFGGKAV